MAESDTPRTDALHAKCIEIEALCWMAGREYVVMRELARTLERELATLRERLADMEQEAIARDAFQTRLKELKYEAEQRAERAEALADERTRAAVAAERERREQLEAALRELVRLKAIKDRIDAHLADESERIDYAVNKPHAWHNARALIGEA